MALSCFPDGHYCSAIREWNKHDAGSTNSPLSPARAFARTLRSNVMEPSTKYRVLVVDDEASIRKTLAMILEAAGYDVSTARHGFDALLQIKSGSVDVVISDLNMPEMSGFEFLSVVRRRFPEIMVIASS